MIGDRFEIHTAGGWPPAWRRQRYPKVNGACKTAADSISGYVVDLAAHGIGETVVYESPGYQKRYPRGGGGGFDGGGEPVRPNSQMWTDGARPDWVSW